MPLFHKQFSDEVFASTELGSLEIHARTIIPFAIGSTIHHLVFVVFLWVANDVFARGKVIIYTTDVEVLDIGHLLAQFYLPFLQAHLLRLNDMGDNLLLFFPLGGFLGRVCGFAR